MKEPRGDRPPNDEDLPRTPATLPALLRRSRDHLARHEPDQALAAFEQVGLLGAAAHAAAEASRRRRSSRDRSSHRLIPGSRR